MTSAGFKMGANGWYRDNAGNKVFCVLDTFDNTYGVCDEEITDAEDGSHYVDENGFFLGEEGDPGFPSHIKGEWNALETRQEAGEL